MKQILCGLILISCLAALNSQQLFINEFMADNDNIIADEQGDFDDWIEIYNPNNEPVDLGGYFLSDTEDELDQYEIPTDSPDITTIPAGGFIIIWCDDDDNDGPLHTNFKLSADGEAIFLTEWNGAVITDFHEFSAQTTDISEGRVSDGADEWQFFASPTPGASNSGNNQPPLITDWQQLNLIPAAGEDVDIVAIVTDQDLDEVIINYNSGSGWQETPMYDDGAHNDGAAGDNLFGGTIPGFSQGTVVSYYLEAIDEGESSSFFPVTAPETLIMYENGWLHPQLVINEFMASNETTISDPQGEYEDWIEIYNAGTIPVDLAGYYFTDDFTNLSSWHRIPGTYPDSTTIAPGEFLLLWADDDEDEGILHLNFKLSADGENFGFYAYYATTPVDSLSYSPLDNDVSMGRLPDGSDNWDFFGSGQDNPATPGCANQPSENDNNNIATSNQIIFTAYPNPFQQLSNRSRISINLFTEIDTDLQIGIYNIKGQIIATQVFPELPKGNNTLSLNIPKNLPAGIYLLKPHGTGQVCGQKVIIIR